MKTYLDKSSAVRTARKLGYDPAESVRQIKGGFWEVADPAPVTTVLSPTKRQLVSNLLQRSEGATRREILDATGWTAVSVQAVAQASGLTLRQEKPKGERVIRYYGAAPRTAPPARSAIKPRRERAQPQPQRKTARSTRVQPDAR